MPTDSSPSETVEQDGRPDKKVYQLSDAGREALAKWVITPTPLTPLRDELGVKLRGAEHGDLGTIITELEAHRDLYRRQLAAYEGFALDYPDPESLTGRRLHQYLVLRGGIRGAQSAIDWCDESSTDQAASTARPTSDPAHPIHSPPHPQPNQVTAQPAINRRIPPWPLLPCRSSRTPTTPSSWSPSRSTGSPLPNRIIMGSMHTGLEDRAWDTDKLAEYYAARARRRRPDHHRRLRDQPHRTAGHPGRQMTNRLDVARHRTITRAVHEGGGRIAMQLIHAGRYGYSPVQGGRRLRAVADPPVQAPQDDQPDHLARHPQLRPVRQVGREGRLRRDRAHGRRGLPHQPIPLPAHQRPHRQGWQRREPAAFPRRGHQGSPQAGLPGFPIILRQSVADFVKKGQTWDEIALMARKAQEHGVDAINTDIGWHEAGVPTIVTSVPRAAFVRFTERLRDEVSIPLIASNRINTPEVAEDILERGRVDAVSMARPLLADPEFADKAREGRADEINTCIGCNRACLDHAFVGKKVSCLLNPRAGRETTLKLGATRLARHVAVIGAGPAGLAAAVSAAQRGHRVELFEAGESVGGQFSIAARIPGKEEFNETLRYFTRQLEITNVIVRLGKRVTAEEILDGSASAADGDAAKFTDVVIATGVVPRIPDIPGIDHPMVMSYAEAVLGHREIGKRVAVIGAGGIGFDVSEFLTTDESPTLNLKGMGAGMGRLRGPIGPRFRHQAAPPARDPAGLHGPAQAWRPGQDLGQDHRLGAPGDGQDEGRRTDLRRDLRLDRRRGPAPDPARQRGQRDRQASPRSRQHRRVRGPGIGARPRRPAHRRRCHDPRDRWRRPRLGARREAGHPSRDRGRRLLP